MNCNVYFVGLERKPAISQNVDILFTRIKDQYDAF